MEQYTIVADFSNPLPSQHEEAIKNFIEKFIGGKVITFRRVRDPRLGQSQPVSPAEDTVIDTFRN